MPEQLAIDERRSGELLRKLTGVLIVPREVRSIVELHTCAGHAREASTWKTYLRPRSELLGSHLPGFGN